MKQWLIRRGLAALPLVTLGALWLDACSSSESGPASSEQAALPKVPPVDGLELEVKPSTAARPMPEVPPVIAIVLLEFVILPVFPALGEGREGCPRRAHSRPQLLAEAVHHEPPACNINQRFRPVNGRFRNLC